MGHPCTKSYSLFIYLKFRFNWTPRPFICCNGRLCQGEGGPQERDSALRIKRVNGTQAPGCRCVPGHFPGVILLRPRSLAYVWSICSLIQPCCALAAVGQGRAPEPPFPGPARLQHPPPPASAPCCSPLSHQPREAPRACVSGSPLLLGPGAGWRTTGFHS